MKKFERYTGITLIALIITVVVLMILAAVGITVLIGNNGILTRALASKEETSLTSAQEAVEFAVSSCQITYLSDSSSSSNLTLSNWLTTEKINNELKGYGYYVCLSSTDATEIIEDTNFSTNKTLYVTSKEDNAQEIYQIDLEIDDDKSTITIGAISKSEVTGTTTNIEVTEVSQTMQDEESEDIITATDIANNPSIYYGTIVDYDAGIDSVNWEILYADEINIYLIASDYISISDCPNNSILTENGTEYEISFGDLTSYSGSSDITNDTIKNLNSSFFGKYTSENTNMKAVAYMLDTSVWSSIKGSKAEYAIGGPTIELLINSYNQKYNKSYEAKAVSKLGYQISKDGSTFENEIDEMFLSSDSLYVINSQEKASAMWVASPSNEIENALMRVKFNGSVGVGYTNYDYPGFRPVICLSSDTEIELVNYVYTVVE